MERDNTADIAKGLAMILVVIGHCTLSTGLQGFLRTFVCMFHVGVFFFMSGYFFNIKYIDDKWLFIKKKIKDLYVPFVRWTLFFVLLHNVFFSLHMIDSTYPGYVAHYELNDYLIHVVKTILFQSNELLLGAFWFIPALFLASIISLYTLWVVRYAVSRFGNVEDKRELKDMSALNDSNSILGGAISIIILIVIAMVLFLLDIPQLGKVSRTFLTSAIFLFGYLMSKTGFVQKGNWFTGVFIIVFIFIVSLASPITLSPQVFWQVPFIVLINVMGSWMCMIISRYIKILNTSKLVSYIGRNSLVILALHMSCFKIVDYIKVKYYNLEIDNMENFTFFKDDPSGNHFVWVILYVLVGVGLPVGLKYLYDQCKLKLINKEN